MRPFPNSDTTSDFITEGKSKPLSSDVLLSFAHCAQNVILTEHMTEF